MNRPRQIETTLGVEAVDPHGIVSIAGGDWTVDHPVAIFNAEQRSLASTSTRFPASRSRILRQVRNRDGMAEFQAAPRGREQILEREHEKAFDFRRRGDRLRSIFWQCRTGRGRLARVLPP
jgi:hypothetical protein